ncbi:hypothetical protein QNO07_09980 [Streptomyces sp. 549]|uniref:hypothetical protein n=1 Tax=Streptomyces sp. 549 TaxID=3049076 RepID=UPI0024C3F65D|nr:hypothetical protein [Streptomyces sp. 549]MDK1473745.1 hypothetical protein [Streptomyces sp. 549]
MSGGEDDLDISPEAVALITNGLRGAMDELADIGGVTGSRTGSGVGGLALTKMEAGSSEVADAFDGFCDRWEWGVRALVQDANQLARRLGLAAGMTWEEDRYREGTFKIVANAVSPTGNPHLTEEEIEKQGWKELLTPDAPDYSQESRDQAVADIKQSWKDTGDPELGIRSTQGEQD